MILLEKIDLINYLAILKSEKSNAPAQQIFLFLEWDFSIAGWIPNKGKAIRRIIKGKALIWNSLFIISKELGKRLLFPLLLEGNYFGKKGG